MTLSLQASSESTSAVLGSSQVGHERPYSLVAESGHSTARFTQTRKFVRAIGIEDKGSGMRERSPSPARLGCVEACSFGLVDASFIALKSLLGLRTSKQTKRFAIANSAGKSFRLCNIKFMPGGLQTVRHNCRVRPIARHKQAAKSQRA